MVFKYCFGMIMSVSTLMIFRGAATPSSVVNFSIDRTSRLNQGQGRQFIANMAPAKGQFGHRSFVLTRFLEANRSPLRSKTLWPAQPLAGTRLDRLHVGVRQPKMV